MKTQHYFPNSKNYKDKIENELSKHHSIQKMKENKRKRKK
jgi:hypothetical protein